MIERPEQMNIDATFGVTFAEGNFFINFYHQSLTNVRTQKCTSFYVFAGVSKSGHVCGTA